MLRADQLCRFAIKLFLYTLVILPLLVGRLYADNATGRVSVDKGRELFQREWNFEPQNPPSRFEGATVDFERRLMALPGDGLGPMHNAKSCESCHANGGGAGIERNVTLLTLDPRSKLSSGAQGVHDPRAIRDRVREKLLDLYPGLLSPMGALSMETVLHEKSTRPLYELIRNRIASNVSGGADAEWFKSDQRTVRAVADQPVLAGRMGEIDFYLSQRNSPALHGLNLIDQVDMKRLSIIAEAQARRTEGKVTGRVGAGRFGWRAQTATLDQFVRGACANELGLQIGGNRQAVDPADESYVSLGMDMKEMEVRSLAAYVRSLPPPTPDSNLPESVTGVREGKQLFIKIGCADCHIENVLPAQGVYSDLLLHDMGDLLQAPSPAPVGSLTKVSMRGVPSFPPSKPPLGTHLFFRMQSSGGYFGSRSRSSGFRSAHIPAPYSIARPAEPRFPRGKLPEGMNVTWIGWDDLQREWRTPPLWGVADSAPYLHDGRASTLNSAIRWHGGEGADSANNYRDLLPEDRKKLIAFLASLRAPTDARRQIKDQQVGPVNALAIETPLERLQALAQSVNVFE